MASIMPLLFMAFVFAMFIWLFVIIRNFKSKQARQKMAEQRMLQALLHSKNKKSVDLGIGQATIYSKQ